MKKWICALAALLLAFPFSGAGAKEPDGAFPELNGDGFLDEGEFVYENSEDGVWRYASAELKVEIFRRTQEKPAQTWYEAEIWCAEGTGGPRVISNDPEKWAKSKQYPYKIARKTGTVIAVSADYAQQRVEEKSRVGIVIRDGRIISDRTYPKNSKHFPNLDCLALYPDGEMKVFDSDERTAEEYLADGAADVLAFGPWLIRDGEKNEKGLATYGQSSAQRVAVGMTGTGHYFFMMLEGRIKGRSRGAGIDFLAEKLAEKGCTVAFNLDGGQTASIVFMGHQLCKMDDRPRNLSSRKASDILGVGHSDLLPAVGDPW